MGAVQIETYNFGLMNIADYSNKTQLKNLLKNFSNLLELAQCGDTVAASIYVDLKESLDPTKQILTETQHNCIIRHFIQRMTLEEISILEGNDATAVKYCIDRGILRIQAALLDGRLYEAH